MLRFFSLIFLITNLLLASLNDDILKRATELSKSQNQSDIFRAYNDYKNLYLRAIVENDDNLKHDSLKGIVSSGKKLKIDVTSYEKELAKLPSKQVSTPKKPQVQVIKKNRLKSTKWVSDELHIVFENPISSVKSSTFHQTNSFKYIYDIDSSYITSAQNVHRAGVDRISVAQFTPQALRVVVQNSKKVELTHKVAGNELIIYFAKSTAKAATTTKSTKSLKPKTIVIDPGHGGNDPGAIGFKKYKEKEIVFVISKEVEKILKSRGHSVFMTRNRDVFVKLSERTKFANKKSADIFVSVHANAIAKPNVKGIETYFLSPSRSTRAKNVAAAENSADLSDMNMYGKDSYLNLLNHHNILASNKLAIDIQRGILASLRTKYKGVEDMGVKEGPFWVLVGAAMPSVLIEVGFVTNQEEAKRLSSSDYQKLLAQGIADGLERYLINN